MEHSFNLIDESWLRVLTNDCRLKEISLKDAFINAHNIADLSGETRAQDVALLRLLAAVMYTVFSRYGLNGEDIDLLEDTEIPLNQWEDMWRQGYIPSAPIERYFAEWHDRFWLFDEQYPFYQSNIAAEKGIENENGKEASYFSSAKLIGTLSESGNKKRIFASRYGNGRNLSYSEAARWLIHLNCFDDVASKYTNKAEGLIQQSPRRTWVSHLGLIAMKGKNLFETILLNFRADYDVKKGVYKETPSWEQDNRNPKYK
ncbi:MAG: type I-E CRISPR-associated protein Cse1/CasA, partial [Synergistaceae bacterium]|nr:type I-E CRISPR-associated protein Cse1/CasA [Synergistaceae bacterium]